MTTPTATPAAVAPELEGKAAAGATPAASPSPELVEVTLGDKAVKVDKATADALSAFQQSVVEAGVATKQELTNLKAQLASLTKPAPTNSENDASDLAQLIFTDPEKAVQLITKKISDNVNSQLAVTSQQQQFWSEFYSQNPELKQHDWVVKAVMTRDFESYKPLQVTEVLKKLAVTVKSDILKLGKGGGDGSEGSMIEGGTETNTPRSKPNKQESERQPTTLSLSAVLKKRAEARKAAGKGASA